MSLWEVFAPANTYLDEEIPITEFDQAMWDITVDDLPSVPDKVQWVDPGSTNYEGYSSFKW